jgi:hypothetical protein
MAADMEHQPLPDLFDETLAYQPDMGTVIPLPRQSPEQLLDPKEREMLHAFYNFAQANSELNPQTATANQMPKLSEISHEFLATFSRRQIDIINARQAAQAAARNEGPVAAQLFVMPPASVKRHIAEHYAIYGTRRRTTSDELRTIEEEALTAKKKHLLAPVYGGGGYDEDGVEQPIKEISTRAAMYPEAVLGIHLEAALRTVGHETAADSVEVVLAAYGTRLGEIRAGAIARRGVVRISEYGSSMIRQPDTSQLPEELQAEKYHPKPE